MSEMTKLIHKEDIIDVNKNIESLKNEQRNFAISFMEKIDRDKGEIIGPEICSYQILQFVLHLLPLKYP